MLQSLSDSVLSAWLKRVVTLAILVTVLAVSWMSWSLLNVYELASDDMPQALQMEELHGRLVWLASGSTMSARMAVVTGDKLWEDRYHDLQSQESRALKEVPVAALKPTAKRLLEEASAANVQTDLIEAQALEHLHQKRGAAALALLDGSDYQKYQKTYDNNLRELGSLLQNTATHSQLKIQREAHSSLIIVASVAIILLLCWCYILFVVRRWQKVLLLANTQLSQQSVKLESFSQELDRKVEERTKELKESQNALMIVMDDAKRSRESVRVTLHDLQDEVEERKKIEAQLAQSQKMDAIGKLAGGVAHDFNNQLNVIMGFAGMLSEMLTDPKLKRYADNISTSALRSADLTRKLLAFSRKHQTQAVPLSIHKILNETVEMLERSIDKRIEIKQQLRASQDIIVGDPSQLQNALLNLAVNARDAMPNGGSLTLETSLVSLDSAGIAKMGSDAVPGRYVNVRIADTGTGMSDEVKKHLFEPFFTTKALGKGTGMGLSSVDSTVKYHKGIIEVSSEEGKGTTFTLHFPLALQITMANAAATTASKTVRPLRILLVEDEKMLREMLIEMLNAGSHEVLESENGRSAVELYRQLWTTIDLVILDMIMPEMNGPDTLQAMKKINPNVKALLSTGFSLNTDVQTVLDEGILGFIQKPFTPDELLTLIAKVIRKEGQPPSGQFPTPIFE